MKKKILFSFAYEDAHLVPYAIDKLKEQNLIEDHDFEILNPKDIAIGDHWVNEFKKMVHSAAMVVIIKSKFGVKSPTVNYEAGMADAFDKPIIVFEVKDAGERGFLAYLSNYQFFPLDEAV